MGKAAATLKHCSGTGYATLPNARVQPSKFNCVIDVQGQVNYITRSYREGTCTDLMVAVHGDGGSGGWNGGEETGGEGEELLLMEDGSVNSISPQPK